MKKLISLLVASIMVFGVTVVSAAATVSQKIENNKIVVTISGDTVPGSVYQPVNLYVTRPDTNTGSVQNDLAHAEQRLSDANGAYRFTFALNPDIRGGVCYYTINTKGGTKQTDTFLIPDMKTKLETMENVNQANSADAVQTVLSGKELSLNMNIYNQIDKAFLGEKLYALIQGGTQFTDVNVFDNKIKEFTVLSALNQEVSGIVEGGKLVYLESLGVTEANIDNYNTALTPNGISNINANMQGKDFKDSSEAAAAFDKLLYTNMITNNKTVGIAQVDAIIKNHGQLLGINVAEYEAADDKDFIQRALVNSKAATSENLVIAFNNAIHDNDDDQEPVKVSGGSHGGGGGSVFTPSVTPVQPIGEGGDQAALKYKDLEGFEWAKEAISTLTNAKVVNGESEDIFAPDKNITREQFIKMLMSALDLVNDKTYDIKFSDVDQNAWYHKYIQSAVGQGIVNGISEDTFGINEEITRQDMLTMAFRALRLTPVTIDTDIASVSFADQDQIAEYSKSSVKVFKKMNLISGYPDGTFKPINKTTRAEAAQIIYKLLMLKGGAQ